MSIIKVDYGDVYGIDLSNPTTSWYKASMASGSSDTKQGLPSTPRYIIFSCLATSGMAAAIDVKRNKAYRVRYTGTQWYAEDWSGWTSYITSITSTSVTFTNAASSAANYCALIYC